MSFFVSFLMTMVRRAALPVVLLWCEAALANARGAGMSLLDVQRSAWANFEWQRDFRRDLHRHPELAMYEHWTSNRLQEELKTLGISSFTAGLGLRELPLNKEPTEAVDRTRKDLEGKTAGGTGIIVDMGTGKEPCVAIRADMDALPIHEDTGLAFQSQIPGRMHACGHDSHMAMTMGVARILKEREEQLKGTVRLVFQPSEEIYGGAQDMVLDGALSRSPAVESIWGLHVAPAQPSGFLGTVPGPIMAKAYLFSIVIKGSGGHAGMPFQTKDPVPTAALVITALHTFLPRRISTTIPHLAGLISITSVKSSSEAYNVLPDSVEIRGTLRALKGTYGDELMQALRDMVAGIVEGNGQSCEVELLSAYPEVHNDPELFEFGRDILNRGIAEHGKQAREEFKVPVHNYTVIDPRMGAEDFAYYCRHAKCLFTFIGAGSNHTFPLHHQKMTIDEEIMPAGSAYLAYTAIQRLEYLSAQNKKKKETEKGGVVDEL